MANKFVRGRGVKPIKHIDASYCPKCEMWGFRQIALTQVGNRQIIAYCHQEHIAGKQFTYRRCYIG